MLFPLPRPLPDLLRDTTSSLAPIDKAGAVANALLLASHPWLLRSSLSPPRWTLDSLRSELAPLFQPNTHCAGDLHWAHDTSFAQLLDYMPTSVAALRTCKSGVLVGCARETEAAAAAAHPEKWLVGGLYGMVQLREA